MNTNETNTEIKLKPGRPIVSSSVRQQKLQAALERRQRGEVIPKGRPINPSSKRQQEANQKQQIIESGGIIRPGRPKMDKDNTNTKDTMVGELKTDTIPKDMEIQVG